MTPTSPTRPTDSNRAAAPPLADLVLLHCEEAVRIALQRDRLVSAPHMTLGLLHREDQRLAAHLDGIIVACDSGWAVPWDELGPGSDFLRGYLAVAVDQSRELVTELDSRGANDAHFLKALAWTSTSNLQGVVPALLASSEPVAWRRAIAICAMHRVNPGRALRSAMTSADATLRAQALRAAGELGDQSMTQPCIDALADDDETCRAEACRSAVLLGNRGAALQELTRLAARPGPHHDTALALFLRVSEINDGHWFLADVVKRTGDQRSLITGAGILGDSKYVPWLLEQMKEPKLARLAGEAFTTVTGVDLFMGYDTSRPVGFDNGPTDDPDDDNVDLDVDEDLPWPDVTKIESWWASNAARFQVGARRLLGQPVTPTHCGHVLKTGYQRQRIAAAQYLSLMNPGTPLFNTSAPAWRQQRLLAEMK